MMKKFMLRVMPVLFMALVIWSGTVYGIDVAAPKGNEVSGNLQTVMNKVWGTVQAVVQVLAVAAVVIAGIRYMFASADAKADIKKQTIIIIVGAVLVFAAVPVLTMIQNIARDILPQQ